jgi:hypothetical protein
MTRVVLAPAPPSGPPVPTTSYGVITVFNSSNFSGGTVTLRISTDSNGPFYVEKILIFLNGPVQADILLASISIDGAYVFNFNNYFQQPTRVVVVSSGSTIGDIVASVPSYMSSLLTKDPIGNIAMFASGATNGLAVGLTSPNGFVGTTFSALAFVEAPSSATVTLSFS